MVCKSSNLSRNKGYLLPHPEFNKNARWTFDIQGWAVSSDSYKFSEGRKVWGGG